MSPSPSRHCATRNAWLSDLLADTDVQARPMFGCPAFFRGGRLFACVYGEEIGLKLPEAQVAELLTRSGYEAFTPYGKRPMREWVAVHTDPSETPSVGELVHEAMTFVRGESR